jgi:hypothetical protein
LVTKEELATNVGVDGQTWQGLLASIQTGPLYLVQGETATCTFLALSKMAQVREVFVCLFVSVLVLCWPLREVLEGIKKRIKLDWWSSPSGGVPA